MIRRNRAVTRMIPPFFWSLGAAPRLRPRFSEIELHLMFIGYPRSGHSLVGALLNAHPNIVVSHELDALQYVDFGFSRDQIFSLILRRDRQFIAQGARWTEYDYSVSNSGQGRIDAIRVIGDKKGGRSSLRIAAKPELLPRLERLVGEEIRFLHVTRNPFDIIATMQRRGSVPVERLITQFARHCEGSEIALKFAGPDRSMTLALEDLIAHPEDSIRSLCSYLGHNAPDDYVKVCADRIFETGRKTRESVAWRPDLIRSVVELIERYPFLARYAADLPEAVPFHAPSFGDQPGSSA